MVIKRRMYGNQNRTGVVKAFVVTEELPKVGEPSDIGDPNWIIKSIEPAHLDIEQRLRDDDIAVDYDFYVAKEFNVEDNEEGPDYYYAVKKEK